MATNTRESAFGIGPDGPATQRQLRYLQAIAREAGYDAAALDNRAVQAFGVQAAALSRRQASTLIDLIQTDKKTWEKV